MLDARLAFTFRPRLELPLGAHWQCNMSGEVLWHLTPEPGQQWGGRLSAFFWPFLDACSKYSMTSRRLGDSMAETFSIKRNFLSWLAGWKDFKYSMRTLNICVWFLFLKKRLRVNISILLCLMITIWCKNHGFLHSFSPIPQPPRMGHQHAPTIQ